MELQNKNIKYLCCEKNSRQSPVFPLFNLSTLSVLNFRLSLVQSVLVKWTPRLQERYFVLSHQFIKSQRTIHVVCVFSGNFPFQQGHKAHAGTKSKEVRTRILISSLLLMHFVFFLISVHFRTAGDYQSTIAAQFFITPNNNFFLIVSCLFQFVS